MDPDALARLIRSTAFDLGFDLVGVAPAGPSPDVDRFRSWLESGFDGAMAYLARRAQERADPRSLVPEAQTVIVLGASYFVDVSTPSLHGDPSRGRIASYAWGDDYHEALKPLLFELDARIRAATGRTSPGRAYVDTGPILERSWAATAGLGFIGKNTCLIAPRLGSWVFLGVLLVPEVVEGGGWSVKSEEWSEKDEDSRGVLPSTFHPPLSAHRPSLFTCAACTRCLDVCPTQALPAPHLLDARRCISYLTIELDGPIPHVLRPAMGNWIFGCDLCQDVCPYNRRFARPARLDAFRPRPERVMPTLLDLLALDEAGFRQRFRNSPVRRTKRRGLLRNVCVALGNGNDSTAVPALVSALDDHEPLIRGHAAWALGRIDARIRKRPNPGARSETDPSDDRSIRNALTTRQSIETDPYVLHEIGDALEASLHTEN
jgi:epoxyqueuosine reductase